LGIAISLFFEVSRPLGAMPRPGHAGRSCVIAYALGPSGSSRGWERAHRPGRWFAGGRWRSGWSTRRSDWSNL